MESWPTRRAVRYTAPAVVILVFGIIVSNMQWNPEDQYTDPVAFVGCYYDAAGTELRLRDDGELTSGNEKVGSYRVIKPVGGKHGYIIDVNGTSIRRNGNGLSFSPGKAGYYWNVAPDGAIRVLAEPDIEDRLIRHPPSDMRLNAAK